MASAEEILSAALAQHRAGNLPQAESLYRKVLAQEPRAADAWHLLGALCIQANRPDEAVSAIQQAIRLNSANPDYFSHLGAAHSALGQHESAIDSLRHAVRLAPQSSSAHYNLGTALRNAGQIEQSVASFRHAVAADPQAAEAHFNLANSLRDLQQYQQAAESYRAAIAARPGYLKAMINLGGVLSDLKQHEQALDILRQVVALQPGNARAQLNLGSVLRDAGRFQEAITQLEMAVSLAPELAEAHNNLGTAYQTQADFAHAAACYQRALELSPELPDAHFSLATHYLREGDWVRGFAEYEWRWKCRSFGKRPFSQPRWRGEPLNGHSILLYAEQGLGDTLHFVRFVRDVRQRGGRVVLECQPPLVQLLGSLDDVEAIIPHGQPLPPFDVHCPLMSLPAALALEESQFTRGAYLAADPARVEAWRGRLPEAPLRVGLCWQGNPEHLFDSQRSLPLASLAPLTRVPRATFISLQRSADCEQLAASPLPIVDLGPTLDADAAFVDTAAIMQDLDLVIAVDTAVAHLAGALAVPVWIPLSAHSDWRWLRERTDSVWYPTARLFRQRVLDAWDDVVAEMAAALANFRRA